MSVDGESTGRRAARLGDLYAVAFDSDAMQRPAGGCFVDGAINRRPPVGRYVHAGSAVKDDAGLTGGDPRRPPGTDVASIPGDDADRHGPGEY